MNRTKDITLRQIAVYRCPLPSKFGIPRQSGVVSEIEGQVQMCREYANGTFLKGIEDFEYIWLLWGFSLNRDNVREHGMVRPPRLGGNRSMGVFATRSPYRPNPVGLSSVRLVSVENGALNVRGADLADGTPIYDIKPYLPYTDSHTGAKAGFADDTQWDRLEVLMPEDVETEIEAMAGKEAVSAVRALLSQDPRPRYQNDPERIYGMTYGNMDIHFRVEDGVLRVTGTELNAGSADILPADGHSY